MSGEMIGCCSRVQSRSPANAIATSACLVRAVEIAVSPRKADMCRRALTCSKEESVLAHADSDVSITFATPPSGRVVQQLEITLQKVTLFPTPELGDGESPRDGEQSNSCTLDKTSNSGNRAEANLLSTALRRSKKPGFRRRRRMSPQAAWTSDDFARNAECILDSIFSRPCTQGVKDVLDSWLGQVTRVELGQVIKDLGYRNQPHLAMDVFCWMSNQRGRLKPNAHMYSSIFGMLGRAGMVGKAQEIFDDQNLQSLKSIHLYNAMIGAYVKCGDFQRAWSLYKDVCKRGLEVDEVTFNTLLNGIARNDVPLMKIEMLLTRMKKAGIAPSRYTYNTVLTALSNFGRIDTAAAIFEDMRASKELPDLITFNTIINMYRRAGQREKALHAFDLLLDSGLHPDAATYVPLMQLFGKANDTEAALGKFNEMRRRGCALDVSAFSLIVHIYGRAGRVEEAEVVLEEMRNAGVQPNTVTWSSLIQAYGKKGMIGKVESSFAEMQRSGCQPDASLFNIMMTAYAEAGLSNHAAFLFRRMYSAGVKPDTACFNTMIHALAKSGQQQDAEAMHQEMVQAGFVADKLSRRYLRRLAGGKS